jgi:hypothetical protein
MTYPLLVAKAAIGISIKSKYAEVSQREIENSGHMLPLNPFFIAATPFHAQGISSPSTPLMYSPSIYTSNFDTRY